MPTFAVSPASLSSTAALRTSTSTLRKARAIKVVGKSARQSPTLRRGALTTTCGDKVFGYELPDAMSGFEPLAHVWRTSIAVGCIAGVCKLEASVGPEVWNSYVGPGGCALAAVWVTYFTVNGAVQIKSIKADLEERGYDTSGINRITMLKYLQENVNSEDEDEIALAREVLSCNLCIQCMQFGSGPEFVKWRKYYAERGIELKTVADLVKVQDYLEEFKQGVA